MSKGGVIAGMAAAVCGTVIATHARCNGTGIYYHHNQLSQDEAALFEDDMKALFPDSGVPDLKAKVFTDQGKEIETLLNGAQSANSDMQLLNQVPEAPKLLADSKNQARLEEFLLAGEGGIDSELTKLEGFFERYFNAVSLAPEWQLDSPSALGLRKQLTQSALALEKRELDALDYVETHHGRAEDEAIKFDSQSEDAKFADLMVQVNSANDDVVRDSEAWMEEIMRPQMEAFEKLEKDNEEFANKMKGIFHVKD